MNNAERRATILARKQNLSETIIVDKEIGPDTNIDDIEIVPDDEEVDWRNFQPVIEYD